MKELGKMTERSALRARVGGVEGEKGESSEGFGGQPSAPR